MTIRQAGNPIQRDGCCRDERVAFVNKTELRDPAFHRSEVDGEGRLVPQAHCRPPRASFPARPS